MASFVQELLAEQGENLPFPRFHALGLLDAPPLMIVAEQMENAVQQQKNQLAFEGDAGLGGIPGRCLGGDHHIAKQLGAKIPSLPLAHGEGDDVGRLVPLQIVAIDDADLGIVDDQDRQFRLRTSRDA